MNSKFDLVKNQYEQELELVLEKIRAKIWANEGLSLREVVILSEARALEKLRSSSNIGGSK